MTISISSLSISQGLRSSLQRIQTQIDDANTELGTGRYADVGLTLGSITGTAVSYHLAADSADRQITSNKLVASRFDAINKALDNLRSSAQTVSQVAITGFSNQTKLTSAQQTSASALQVLSGSLNTSLNGQYLFSGDQTDQPALNDYTTGSAAKNATAASFSSYLTSIGKTTSSITGTEMQAYLDGPYTQLFDTTTAGAGWNLWSNASDNQVQSRISSTETIESSLSGNDQAFRDLASGYAMVNDLASASLGDDAKAVLAKNAQSKITAGIDGVTRIQADVGFRETRIDTANTALTNQKDIMTKSIDSLEGVDPQEATIRLDALSTQLNISYAATGKIMKLSILDYI